MGQIIDGKAIAERIKLEVKSRVERLKKEKGLVPKIAVVLVGEDPASLSYIKGKEKASAEVGIESMVHRLPSDIKEESVIGLIESMNADSHIHAILVQLPLPSHINEERVLEAIDPKKDVDGLHPLNMGNLFKGKDPLFIPCTPAGILELILSTGVDITGKNAVVVGRSNLVGKPTAILLLKSHATVTICHTKTKNLGDVTVQADILVVAAGKAKIVTPKMVKRGAIVIDVGINRVESGICGDVDFEGAKEIASYITPVPGGVGPMTVAMLLKNVALAAERFSGSAPTAPEAPQGKPFVPPFYA